MTKYDQIKTTKTAHNAIYITHHVECAECGVWKDGVKCQ